MFTPWPSLTFFCLSCFSSNIGQVCGEGGWRPARTGCWGSSETWKGQSCGLQQSEKPHEISSLQCEDMLVGQKWWFHDDVLIFLPTRMFRGSKKWWAHFHTFPICHPFCFFFFAFFSNKTRVPSHCVSCLRLSRSQVFCASNPKAYHPEGASTRGGGMHGTRVCLIGSALPALR